MWGDRTEHHPRSGIFAADDLLRQPAVRKFLCIRLISFPRTETVPVTASQMCAHMLPVCDAGDFIIGFDDIVNFFQQRRYIFKLPEQINLSRVNDNDFICISSDLI